MLFRKKKIRWKISIFFFWLKFFQGFSNMFPFSIFVFFLKFFDIISCSYYLNDYTRICLLSLLYCVSIRNFKIHFTFLRTCLYHVTYTYASSVTGIRCWVFIHSSDEYNLMYCICLMIKISKFLSRLFFEKIYKCISLNMRRLFLKFFEIKRNKNFLSTFCVKKFESSWSLYFLINKKLLMFLCKIKN